jgi:hypothetical protein
MIDSPSLDDWVHDIRRFWRTRRTQDSDQMESQLEEFLSEKLRGLALDDQLLLLQRLRERFKTPPSSGSHGEESEKYDLAGILALLLGQRVATSELSSRDAFRQLTEALNTIFDRLNELVRSMTFGFCEDRPELETIRMRIASDLQSEGQHQSLEAYLDQIKEAFLLTRQAFQMSVRTFVEAKIAHEMDPERMAAEADKGFKPGFMRKAELFEIYRWRFEQFKQWFESPKFEEEFSHEFEQAYQKLYSKQVISH